MSQGTIASWQPSIVLGALLAALAPSACGTSASSGADDSVATEDAAAEPEPAPAASANPEAPTETDVAEPVAMDPADTPEAPAVSIPDLDTTDPVTEPVTPEPAAEPVPEPVSTEPTEPVPAEPIDDPSGEEADPVEPTPADPVANPAEPDAVVPEYPAPGEYGELAPLPEANSEMAVAEAGGLIYVLGGYPSSREVQTTVQAYDPVLDEWSLVAPLPVPLHHPVVVGVDGLLFSLGGQLSHDANPDTDRSLLYDPVTDTWSDLAPMPTARGAGAGVEIDGKIYVVGGRPPAGNAFEVYDIESDTWNTLPALPTTFDERNHLAAAAIDGRVYVAGGRYSGGNFQSPMTASLDIFDPISGTWSLGADLPRPRGGVNGVNAHGCFHVFGGEGSGIGEPNDVFPDHDVYDPGTDSWTSLAPLPVPVHGVTGAVFLNGLIYMPGGGTTSGGSSGSTIFQVYHPTTRCD